MDIRFYIEKDGECLPEVFASGNLPRMGETIVIQGDQNEHTVKGVRYVFYKSAGGDQIATPYVCV